MVTFSSVTSNSPFFLVNVFLVIKPGIFPKGKGFTRYFVLDIHVFQSSLIKSRGTVCGSVRGVVFLFSGRRRQGDLSRLILLSSFDQWSQSWDRRTPVNTDETWFDPCIPHMTKFIYTTRSRNYFHIIL